MDSYNKNSLGDGGVKRRDTLSRRTLTKKERDHIFIFLVVALPFIQFLIFYVYVNINAVVLGFQQYTVDEVTGRGYYTWYGLGNFQQVIKEFEIDGIMLNAFKNSVITWVISTAVSYTLAIIISFYIYKKAFFSKTFRVIVFIPSILSSIVLILLYKYFVDFAVPELWQRLFGKEIEGLASNPQTAFPTVLFYSIWFGFGSGILIFSSTMSGNISDSVVEACHLDGATMLQEIWYITIPAIYPIIMTNLVCSVPGLFLSDPGLFSFFGTGADYKIWTLGYYLTKTTKDATMYNYPYIAAFGLIQTAIILPLVLISRYVMRKYGPNTER